MVHRMLAGYFFIETDHSCPREDLSFRILDRKIASGNWPLASTLDDTGNKGTTTRSICDQFAAMVEDFGDNRVLFSHIF